MPSPPSPPDGVPSAVRLRLPSWRRAASGLPAATGSDPRVLPPQASPTPPRQASSQILMLRGPTTLVALETRWHGKPQTADGRRCRPSEQAGAGCGRRGTPNPVPCRRKIGSVVSTTTWRCWAFDESVCLRTSCRMKTSIFSGLKMGLCCGSASFGRL